jgi:hypothetical protein
MFEQYQNPIALRGCVLAAGLALLAGCGAGGTSSTSTEIAPTPTTPVAAVPATPASLKGMPGNAQASLTWSAVSGAESYAVKRSTTGGGPYASLASVDSPSYTDAAVKNGTLYYYVVAAVNAMGTSPDSTQVSVTPDPAITTPAVPMGLTATAGNAQVSLNWTASSRATSYHVKRSTTSGEPFTQVGAPSSASYTDSSLTNGKTYYYVVSALDSAGESANSAQASAAPAAPAAPTPPPTTPPPTTPPAPTPPAPTPPPTAPLPPGLNFTSAPTLSGVTMVQNRDSVIVQVPAVANARDFRVLVQPTAVAGNTDGTESVSGGTQFCAGVRQHQTRAHYIADNASLYPYFFYTNTGGSSPAAEAAPPNFYSAPTTPWSWFDLDTPPNLQIEVTGVTANMTVIVEALDRLCPFPGPIGQQHADIQLSPGPWVQHPDNPWIDASYITTFPVVTKAEVIAKYGTLIINGQGWAGGPNVQANPPLKPPFAQPAAPNPPKVLARASVTISPLSAPPAAPAAFFDDFSNASDTFKALPVPNWKYPRYTGAGQLVLQNSKWTVYGNGFTCCTPTTPMNGTGYADAYIDDGALHTTLGDWAQGVFSEITMIPRKTAHLNATNYLHVTYEVNSFATNRRYWVFTLCGSSTAGQTMDSNGVIKEQIVHSTFFYNPTGMSPSTAGWNCVQLLNRYGNSYAFSTWENMHKLDGSRPIGPANNGLYDLKDYIYNTVASISDPSKVAAYTVHPESDVVVLVNKPIPAANLPEVGGVNEQVVQSAATSPINVSPLQLDNPAGEVAWFYKVDANGNPIAPILDDQQLVSPRTKYDLYIRNNRLIMYVNGKAALCNDFTTPTTTLNMADAAVGFHEVLYHSDAEFEERFLSPDQGAAYHYRYNSPWLDQRTWDNMGFEENVAAPADFNASICFAHKSLGPENNEP